MLGEIDREALFSEMVEQRKTLDELAMRLRLFDRLPLDNAAFASVCDGVSDAIEQHRRIFELAFPIVESNI